MTITGLLAIEYRLDLLERDEGRLDELLATVAVDDASVWLLEDDAAVLNNHIQQTVVARRGYGVGARYRAGVVRLPSPPEQRGSSVAILSHREYLAIMDVRGEVTHHHHRLASRFGPSSVRLRGRCGGTCYGTARCSTDTQRGRSWIYLVEVVLTEPVLALVGDPPDRRLVAPAVIAGTISHR